MATRVRAFAHQTFHYLARPHQAPRRLPVRTPDAWTVASLRTLAPWYYDLSANEQAECIRAVERGLSLEPDIRRWNTGTFQWRGMDKKIESWRSHLDGRGRGFQLLRGVPVQALGTRGCEAFFWGMGLRLGIPGAQNTDGDLLGHVIDLRDTKPGRLYRTAKAIGFHCDTADVVGLLCVATPKSGGQSRIASSLAIYNALLSERPELIDRFYQPFATDAHGQRGMPFMYTYSARHAHDRLRIFYHSDYFRTGTLKANELCDKRTFELLNRFDALANSPEYCLSMDLEVGDAQFVSNHSIVHSRASYIDHEEPERRRHLLRLWLSLPTESQHRWLKRRAWVRTLGSAAAATMRGWNPQRRQLS